MLDSLAMTPTEKLRSRLRKECEQYSLNSIARQAGIEPATLFRFLEGRPIKSMTVDLLCEYFDLELRPKKRRKSSR